MSSSSSSSSSTTAPFVNALMVVVLLVACIVTINGAAVPKQSPDADDGLIFPANRSVGVQPERRHSEEEKPKPAPQGLDEKADGAEASDEKSKEQEHLEQDEVEDEEKDRMQSKERLEAYGLGQDGENGVIEQEEEEADDWENNVNFYSAQEEEQEENRLDGHPKQAVPKKRRMKRQQQAELALNNTELAVAKIVDAFVKIYLQLRENWGNHTIN